MQIDTLLHTEHQLDQLAGQFEHWRQSRSHPHDRIPDPLWEQAVALTAILSPSRVAKHLRLRVSDLKEQISPPIFVGQNRLTFFTATPSVVRGSCSFL